MQMVEDNKSISYDTFKNDIEAVCDFSEFFFHFKLHNYQKKFLQACLTKKRIAGKWARQSGKSTTVAIYSLFRCLLSQTSIIITAPTMTQSTELYSKIRDYVNINPAIAQELVKFTESEMKFKNGSRIKALPMGSEGKTIVGFTADVTVEEEAGIIPDEINNRVIIPMLASKGDEGQVIKIGTPRTKNHFYRSCFIDPNFEVINITWRDCVKEGQYTQTFVDEQRKNLTDVEFKTEYEAEFIDEMASFFPSHLIEGVMLTYNTIGVV